jgi:hypothetical protein
MEMNRRAEKEGKGLIGKDIPEPDAAAANGAFEMLELPDTRIWQGCSRAC